MLRTSPLFLARSAFVLLAVWACYEFVGLVHSDDHGVLPLVVAGIIAVSALVASIVGFAFCALGRSETPAAPTAMAATRLYVYRRTTYSWRHGIQYGRSASGQRGRAWSIHSYSP
jgi:hypothetical protein